MRYLSFSRASWVFRSIGLFRNRPDVIDGRWGFTFLGLEVGSCNPGDPVGVWLKERGLWPW